MNEKNSQDTSMPSVEDARAMGATGGTVPDGERLAFEAWMAGHCWALSAEWDGEAYRSSVERAGGFDHHASRTRQLWAAWRDRAALAATLASYRAPAAPVAQGVLDKVLARLEYIRGFRGELSEAKKAVVWAIDDIKRYRAQSADAPKGDPSDEDLREAWRDIVRYSRSEDHFIRLMRDLLARYSTTDAQPSTSAPGSDVENALTDLADWAMDGNIKEAVVQQRLATIRAAIAATSAPEEQP